MRNEFSKSTKREAWARSTGRCEECRLPILGIPEYDHKIPCALGGDNSLENCQVLCGKCHRIKTSKNDVPRIAKADRVRDRRIGIKRGRGFRGWRNFRGEVVRD